MVKLESALATLTSWVTYCSFDASVFRKFEVANSGVGGSSPSRVLFGLVM